MKEEEEPLVAEARRSLAATGAPRRLLVGLSGGADSVSLLHVLTRLGHECVATHCNFHLRGHESDRDMECARRAARSCGAQWRVAHFDVPARMAATGESLEMACRSLRYAWWKEMVATGVADAVAVAHHRDDNIETLLLNLLRGSGVAGLKGMLPRAGDVLRPLLGVSRAQIVDYCRRHGLECVVDSTNLENDCQRNRLRNVVLPELERQFPGAAQGITRSLECLRDDNDLRLDMAERLRRDYENADGEIDVAALCRAEAHPRAALFELVRDRGLNMDQARGIVECAHKSGKTFGAYLLDRGKLKKAEFRKEAGGTLQFRLKPVSEFRPDRSGSALYLDPSALEGDPTWELRPWRHGDRIEPYGMRGSRLVSDLLTDAKVGLDAKAKIRVLTRDGLVVWVPGLRASRHFPVTGPWFVEVRIKEGEEIIS